MTSTSTPTGRLESPDNMRAIGFFDLPREIRDVIYEFSVISMRDDRWNGHNKTMNLDLDWTTQCHCQQDTLAVLRPRQPYFAHHAQSCLVPDRFLLAISMVSKQFSAELRPIFIRNTAFHLDTGTHHQELLRGQFGGPLLNNYREFINALGPEAEELRRLMIVVTKGRPQDGAPTSSPFYAQPEENRDPKPAEAVQELAGLEFALHRSISILLVMRINSPGGLFIVRFFHCRTSYDEDVPFFAEYIDDPSEWEASAEKM